MSDGADAGADGVMRFADGDGDDAVTAGPRDAVSAVIGRAAAMAGTPTMYFDRGRRPRPSRVPLTEASDSRPRTIVGAWRIGEAAGQGGANATSWGTDR